MYIPNAQQFVQNSDVLINLVAGNEVTLSEGIIAPIIIVIGGLCVPIVAVIVGCKCKLLKQTIHKTYTCLLCGIHAVIIGKI